MLIPKENRRKIFEALFADGVLVAPKDFNRPRHPTIDVPNLQVIKAMQSLVSMGHVHIQYSWKWYYYSMTNSGLEYIREWLHIPAEIVPNTYKMHVQTQNFSRAPQRGSGPRRDNDDGYRRRDRDETRRPQFREGLARPTPA